MTVAPVILESRQLHALNRIGDVLIPGDREFPRFSSLSCIEQLDRITAHMPVSDLNDLKLLLTVLSPFPSVGLRILFWLLEFAPAALGPLGSPLRMIRLGLRGLVMTLYYGDPRVLKLLGYEVSVYVGDRA